MNDQERIELAKQICQLCDSGSINVYDVAEMLTRLVDSPRVAQCNCHSVAGRFCREAQGVLQSLQK